MKVHRYFKAFASIFAALVLATCGGKVKSRNYILTIEVETPEGVSSGSSLIEIRNAKRPWYSISENRFSTGVIGKAVRVDLPDGRRLYGLLRNRSGMPISDLIGRTLPPAAEVGEGVDSSRFKEWEMSADNPRLPGGRSGQPMLVTFDDPQDPETLTEVDPSQVELSFGQGYRLKSIRVAQTHDDHSASMPLDLSWLKSIGAKQGTILSDPPRALSDRQPVQSVSPLDFDTELYR